MVKITKMSKIDSDKAIAEAPHRNVGEWKVLLADLKKSNSGAKVTELTRGQVAALIRQCKVDGFNAVATDKYTAVIISAPNLNTKAPK